MTMKDQILTLAAEVDRLKAEVDEILEREEEASCLDGPIYYFEKRKAKRRSIYPRGRRDHDRRISKKRSGQRRTGPNRRKPER